ncbi:MAG: bifunctional oligoribonuclease/PAP phosphatase NrnA [Anaerolineaceae bacterium]|nr:bifunctional oligoribonuclease/PAP phosphatase NrnA [Anaerolineaceae bacterium]
MLRDDLQSIRERLQKAQNIAIFAHVRPDGDSVGSSLALGWALEDIGKTVQWVSEDPIPERYQFLFEFTANGENPYTAEPAGADCYILPDISSKDRAGSFFDRHPDQYPDIGIDHHISNEGFCKLSWIEPESPAACAVLADLIPNLGLTITKRIASALLCGIITDTNSFSNSNVNVRSLRAAADLVEHGADIFSICHKAYKEHSVPEVAFWKTCMNNMKTDGSLIWSVIRKADRDAIGMDSDDDPGFVSWMGNITGMNVSVLFIETNDLQTKISWRALPGYNVSEVAVALGGGGHKAASGATIAKPIDEVIPVVLKKTKEMLF